MSGKWDEMSLEFLRLRVQKELKRPPTSIPYYTLSRGNMMFPFPLMFGWGTGLLNDVECLFLL